MAATDTLSQLIEIASSSSDEAARKLATTQRVLQQAEAKRVLLAGYWSEYQSRQRSIYQADATRLVNFYDFLAKLKSTIESHDEEMDKLQMRSDMDRREWELAQRRLKSLQTLSTRRVAQIRIGMDRAQQKLQDEISAQRLMRNASQAG